MKMIFSTLGIVFLALTVVSFGSWNVGLLEAAPDSFESELAPVNINAASSEDLLLVRGIGPTLADRIVAYRNESGEFQKIEEVMEVNGIGEAKFEKIKGSITV